MEKTSNEQIADSGECEECENVIPPICINMESINGLNFTPPIDIDTESVPIKENKCVNINGSDKIEAQCNINYVCYDENSSTPYEAGLSEDLSNNSNADSAPIVEK